MCYDIYISGTNTTQIFSAFVVHNPKTLLINRITSQYISENGLISTKINHVWPGPVHLSVATFVSTCQAHCLLARSNSVSLLPLFSPSLSLPSLALSLSLYFLLRNIKYSDSDFITKKKQMLQTLCGGFPFGAHFLH